MAYHQSASSTVPANTAPLHDAARGQRTNQLRFIEEKLRNGISAAAVAVITALLAQLETQTTLPRMVVSIVADVAGYKRTMTCQNEVWDGSDLTHAFLADRSTLVYSPSTQTTFEHAVSAV